MQDRADSCEIQHKKRSMHARGFAAWVVGQETNGSSQNCVVQRRMHPFSDGTKASSLLLLLSVQTKRVASLSCKCHPMLRDSAFWGGSDRCRIRRSCEGSVSQRAFAPDGREMFLDFALYGRRNAAGEGKVVFYQAQK